MAVAIKPFPSDLLFKKGANMNDKYHDDRIGFSKSDTVYFSSGFEHYIFGDHISKIHLG